jgi:acetate kinase
MQILVLNGGSSSIKFSVYGAAGSAAAEMERLLDGELSGMGSGTAKLHVGDATREVDAAELGQAIGIALDAVAGAGFESVDAVGHRVVHPGARLKGHQRITAEVMRELEAAQAFAPLHDPEALAVIRAAMKRFPEAAQYACFDTVFHETMPEEATVYALPRAVRAQGVRRYGFHGLSCESVVRQMRAVGAVPRRLVIAHLGSGCSLTALVDGASVDNTMGMTPTGGVVMGTRVGDLDPGVVLYLLRQSGVEDVEAMLNHQAGMVALSGMANDVKAMRSAAEGGDEQARLALRVFTRSVTKAIGAYCFLLGGLDAVVFAGGIGEHDAETRAEVLAGLDGLGIAMGDEATPVGGDVRRISAESSKTAVFVVPADEDHMIALHVAQMAGEICLSG